MIRIVLLTLFLVAVLAGCGRLDHLGKPPTMTAPGAQKPVVETPISAQRAALARPTAPRAEYTTTASTWRYGPGSLFEDRRARTIGDILTVVIEIDDEAEISNTTRRARTAAEDLAVDSALGLTSVADVVLPGANTLSSGVDAASASSSTGDGSVERNEEITLRIAATVVDVLPNGHFVISGSQEVRVNYELRDLQVAGVIRPEDVSRRNEIGYDRIADARIAYGGRGQITDIQQPRYGQQIADIILPF